jgi:hypothetical protein
MTDATNKKRRVYHRNGGRFKKCDCGRRHWARCPHPVWGKFTFRGRDIRVNLGKPRLRLAAASTTTGNQRSRAGSPA